MADRQISEAQWQQLLGLRLLADRHNAALDDIAAAAVEITGEAEKYGHTNDMLYGSREPAELLALLSITVAREVKP